MAAELPRPLLEDPQQAAFYEAISGRDRRLAGWYYGALVALSTPENPEVFVHAAHSVRELMNNLYTVADVPVQAADASRLGDVFNAMVDRWERGRRNTKCFKDGAWFGEIDDPARSAFTGVEKAITWYRENRPRRRETVRSTIRGLDASKRPVPSWVEDTHIELWDELRTFFIDICHHRLETDRDEFLGALGELERFVLDRVTPRTFDQQERLAAIIRQAEGD